MEDEGELIATALVNEFDQQEEKVQDLFQDDDDAVALLEGLRELKLKTEQFSPEDLVWADSCLVTDPELLDESWVYLKQTLLDRITEFATSYEENNATGLDDVVAGNGEQMQVDEKVEETLEIVNNGEDAAHVQTQIGGLTDDDRLEEIESKESIFRVWDIRGEEEENELINELKKAAAVLKVAEEEEEDEFITQLKRAVAESDLRDEAELPTYEPSTTVDEKLDELISSMGDLSLRPSSN